MSQLPHEHARQLLQQAHAHWRRCLRSVCVADADDQESSRAILIATSELEQRRCDYDRLLMQALPSGNRWAREDDSEWHLWCAWNRKLDAAGGVLAMTRVGGALDEVWALGGVVLLPL